MRGLILALLLANVAFFGWAHWIDVPPTAPATVPAPALPLLVLAGPGNARAAAAASTSVRPGPAGPAAPGAPASSGPGQKANGGQARCRSLGPFRNVAISRAVAEALRARGLAPRSRTVNFTVAGSTFSAYWLDVDLAAGASDPPLAALRGRPGSTAAALRGVAFSDCPAAGAGG